MSVAGHEGHYYDSGCCKTKNPQDLKSFGADDRVDNSQITGKSISKQINQGQATLTCPRLQ